MVSGVEFPLALPLFEFERHHHPSETTTTVFVCVSLIMHPRAQADAVMPTQLFELLAVGIYRTMNVKQTRLLVQYECKPFKFKN